LSDVIGLVLPYFGLIFIGFAAAKLSGQSLDALGWMNTFVIYLALPALFFQLLAKTPVEQLTEWGYIAGSVLATYIVFTLMFVGSVLVARGQTAEATIKGLSAAYGNIGYMGPGLAILTFGNEAAVPVTLIICFENIVHFIVAPTAMALSGGEKRDTARLALDVLVKIVTHPFIIATVLGMAAAWSAVPMPAAVERLLTFLSGAAAPCALFAMGVTLALRPLKRMPRELGIIAVLKLVVHPAICYGVLSAIGGFSPTWLFSAVLLASLPSATNVFIIAQQYGVWVQRASASVLVTTLFSVVTVTAWLYAIKNGLLPPDLFP
jgi:predicted permease